MVKKKQIVILKKAKKIGEREMGGCGLAIQLIKVPAGNC